MLKAGRRIKWAVVLGALSAGVVSCTGGGKAPVRPLPARYETLPAKEVPTFLSGTIVQRMDHVNPDPLQVSSFGLVVGLPGTGDGTAPTAVREYVMKQLTVRGFGSVREPELQGLTPERVIDDPGRRTAIVRADGFMPPGVRKGQTFDVVVTALTDSGVTSLAGGRMYRAELKFGGADPRFPAGPSNMEAIGEGPIFINPSLSLNPQASSTDKNTSRFSRRQGVILDGGMAWADQPLVLRLRAPQRSVIRQIENRIDQHFLDPTVASAKDEAILHLTVPESYKGDWERFVGVVMNLYIDGTPESLVTRAKVLAGEAVKKDAPLRNISFAWEGMGAVALPAIAPLMSAENAEDVQFAAARAAAFIGDPGAQTALLRIASTESHRFQIDAVRTLGAIPPTPTLTSAMRKLINSPSTLVRIEAYKVLAANRSPLVVSVVLPEAGRDERFVLDLVQSDQPMLVYATRSGVPRIALIGREAEIRTPITFTALDDRLSITSRPGEAGLTIFHRPPGNDRPVQLLSRTDLKEVVGWLGGAGREPDTRINLGYGDVVAIVQALADDRRLYALSAPSGPVPVAFVLQEAPGVSDLIADAPPIVPRPRGQRGDQAPAIKPVTRPAGGAGVGPQVKVNDSAGVRK